MLKKIIIQQTENNALFHLLAKKKNTLFKIISNAEVRYNYPHDGSWAYTNAVDGPFLIVLKMQRNSAQHD